VVVPVAVTLKVVLPFVQTEVKVGCVVISGTEFTVIAMVFEVAGLADKQGVAFEVKTQEISSPFANAEFV
jgi:steroid 5-alpha reductase family enzyme